MHSIWRNCQQTENDYINSCLTLSLLDPLHWWVMKIICCTSPVTLTGTRGYHQSWAAAGNMCMLGWISICSRQVLSMRWPKPCTRVYYTELQAIPVCCQRRTRYCAIAAESYNVVLRSDVWYDGQIGDPHHRLAPDLRDESRCDAAPAIKINRDWKI